MFDVSFLHLERSFEIEVIAVHFPKGSRILEIGGGTGIQAKMLSEMGYEIESIDISGSNYVDQQVFPVQQYNGRILPFSRGSFDVVFTSNVLEHIDDEGLRGFHLEVRRVLKPSGMCVHVLPTSAWRWWTSVTHIADAPKHALASFYRNFPRQIGVRPWANFIRRVITSCFFIGEYIRPPRHGERGNVLTEMWYFSRAFWVRHFRSNGWTVRMVSPLRLYYSGNMLFGKKISISTRRRLSYLVGSSCCLYVLEAADVV